MPIPQALAAKLAKRGLIAVKASQKESAPLVPIVLPEKEVETTVHEEIIAEDYDDTPQEEVKENTGPITFEKYQGWFSCPNKWNVYHECSTKCIELWKCPKELDKEYNRKRTKMLQKYPIHDHWKEILDVGIGRYYYWNTETDLVSWLPPGHPKCQVSLSAAELRKRMLIEREERMLNEDDMDDQSDEDLSSDEENDLDEKTKLTKTDEIEEKDSSDESEDEIKEKQERERDRKEKDRRKRRKVDKVDLDPMDPAAYSDCPRGTWASGLPERNEARTGVDSTASGPLFQMRPYPNPGAVLRANAAASSVGPKKPT